jgi:hypothetical protein
MIVSTSLGLPISLTCRLSSMKTRVHNLTQYIQGLHYVLDFVDKKTQDRQFYMTASGQGIRANDYILLQDGSQCKQFKVKQIEYHCDSSNMWIALLVTCS